MTTELEFKEMIEQSFTQYAGAVLQSRALVDVRDCLKPSTRQILYCLYTDKFTSDKPFKKTLKSLGSASRIHIHGDSSAEGIIMRSSQPFAMRYPLIEVEGSNGNLIESGNWAAPRYTSSRMNLVSERMFEGLNKNTIDVWYDNYDETEKYPSVLPSIGFYNIVNGTMGIGIGMASSIPSTNLKEVNEAIIKLIQNPDTPFEDIMCYPDFPTGAILLNKSEVLESFRNGRGKACKIRSVINYSEAEKCLVVTEIPYSVYTNTICKELEALIQDEESECGIERFNDLTGEKPLIKIYLKRGANPQKVINYLYKNTSLESYFTINFTMLKDGKHPQVFTWKECLQEYITHIRACKRNELQYDLDKALARENILNGLIRAAASIDEIVACIRASANPQEASEALMRDFGFNEPQTKAILAMKLSALTRIDAIKLNDELAEIKQKIEQCNYLLMDSTALDSCLIDVLREVAEKFGDPRRTQVVDEIEAEAQEDAPLQEIDVNVLYDLRRREVRVVETSKLTNKDARNDLCGHSISNFDSLVAFTNTGKMYTCSLVKLELNKTYSLAELLVGIDFSSEKILKITSMSVFLSYSDLICVTRDGFIKRTSTKEYIGRNKKILKLTEGDEVIGIFLSNNIKDRILVISSSNYYNYYALETFSQVGRMTRGVKAIKLKKPTTEYVLGADLILEYDARKCTKMGNLMISIQDLKPTTRAVKGNAVVPSYNL